MSTSTRITATGVQDAFADDDLVLTISVHEAGRWPHTGDVQDRAGGMARNLPVPPGFNDTEMRCVLQDAILPMLAEFRPQAVFLQLRGRRARGRSAGEAEPVEQRPLVGRRRVA